MLQLIRARSRPCNCARKSELCKRSAGHWNPSSAASLIERFLRTGSSPRTTPAYYLSHSEQGRSKLTYVKKEDLALVRQHCAAHCTFQQNLKQWRQVCATLQQRWKQLQQAQSR